MFMLMRSIDLSFSFLSVKGYQIHWLYWKHSYIQVSLTSEQLSSLSTSTRPNPSESWVFLLECVPECHPLSQPLVFSCLPPAEVYSLGFLFLMPIGNSLLPQGRKYSFHSLDSDLNTVSDFLVLCLSGLDLSSSITALFWRTRRRVTTLQASGHTSLSASAPSCLCCAFLYWFSLVDLILLSPPLTPACVCVRARLQLHLSLLVLSRNSIFGVFLYL